MMAAIMEGLRAAAPTAIAGYPVLCVRDYQLSVETDIVAGTEAPIDLPKSNVITFCLPDGASVVFRPSGTEPKIKAYITATGKTAAAAKEAAEVLTAEAKKMLGQ